MVVGQYLLLNKITSLPQILIAGVACAICELFSGDLDNILCLISYIAVDKLVSIY